MKGIDVKDRTLSGRTKEFYHGNFAMVRCEARRVNTRLSQVGTLSAGGLVSMSPRLWTVDDETGVGDV